MINYTVRRIQTKLAKEYICEHHYSHGCHNGPSPCYGLFDADRLIGVLMFATPCSENVRSSLFGPCEKDRVVELHRLHIMDCTPKNTESWFISRCLSLLSSDRPQTKGVISFSDSTEGHSGVIYKASNAYRCGSTGSAWFYVDSDGRLHHPRQNGKNVSEADGLARGWERVKRTAKNRYVFIVGKDARDKKFWTKRFKSYFHGKIENP